MPCNKFNNLASESTIIGSLTSDIIVLFVFDAFYPCFNWGYWWILGLGAFTGRNMPMSIFQFWRHSCVCVSIVQKLPEILTWNPIRFRKWFPYYRYWIWPGLVLFFVRGVCVNPCSMCDSAGAYPGILRRRWVHLGAYVVDYAIVVLQYTN
jgi:hypothetical protein